MAKILQEISFAEEDNVKKVFVDFRIRSDILDPEEITKDFGINPKTAYAKDDPYQSKARNPKTKQFHLQWQKRPCGIWSLSSENMVSSVRAEDHIQYLLTLLEPIGEKLHFYLSRRETYVVSFYIHWEPVGEWGSYEVDQDLLNRISSLCHYVEFVFMR